MSALSEALLLVLDGLALLPYTIPSSNPNEQITIGWQWVILAVFILFCGFVGWAYRELLKDKERLENTIPKLHVESSPDSPSYGRLLVKNSGGSASFVAKATIVEHETSTPWPIKWRGSYEESQRIDHGDSHFLDIVEHDTRSPHATSSVLPGGYMLKFHTARQAVGADASTNMEIYRHYFDLPSSIYHLNPITLEIAITSDISPMEPYVSRWRLTHTTEGLALIKQ